MKVYVIFDTRERLGSSLAMAETLASVEEAIEQLRQRYRTQVCCPFLMHSFGRVLTREQRPRATLPRSGGSESKAARGGSRTVASAAATATAIICSVLLLRRRRQRPRWHAALRRCLLVPHALESAQHAQLTTPQFRVRLACDRKGSPSPAWWA